MHTGKSYALSEFLLWTRRNLIWPFIVSSIVVALYEFANAKWLAIPWTIVALLGTLTAFIVGFKNTQTYNRTWEARQIWGAVIGNSRGWGLMCRDYFNNTEKTKELIYRHFAWLTALRYQLRVKKEWESVSKSYSQEYLKYYSIPEWETPVEEELAKYLSKEDLHYILPKNNRALQILSLQGKTLKELYELGLIDTFRFQEMHRVLREFFEYQGRSERIKNFPYPRQYATINTFFVHLFCFLLPFGLLKLFDDLNIHVTGLLAGNMVWLVIPFTLIIAWVYTSLDQVGESTENPFEGSPNDIPLAQMSRSVEIDIREMLGETELPQGLQVRNKIVM